MGAKPAAGKGLRIASGCSTLDEFTAVFRKFCTPNSIFIATKVPRPSGIDIQFAITLKDGKPVMAGAGTIKESFETNDNRFERPGMVVEFRKLDTMGRILLRELNASNKAVSSGKSGKKSESFDVPTIVSKPDADDLAAARRSEEREAVQPAGESEDATATDKTDESQGADSSEAEEVEAKRESPEGDSPGRTKGSSIILPANPFGELAAQSLEAFIECTLYEETGELDISALDARQNPIKAPPIEPASPESGESLEQSSKYIPRPPKIPASAQAQPPQPSPARPEVPDVPMLAPSTPDAHAVLASEKSLEAGAAPNVPGATPPPPNVPGATLPPPNAPGATLPPNVPGATLPPPNAPGAVSVQLLVAEGEEVHPVALAPLIPTPAVASQNSPVPIPDGQGSAPHPTAPPRTITVTLNQAIGLVGLCVVAGLGFGLLASGGDDASPKATVAEAAEPAELQPEGTNGDSAPVAKKNTEATNAIANVPPEQTEPKEVAAQPTEIAAEPTEIATEPTEIATEPTEVAAQPTELAAQPTELAAQPTEVAAQPTPPVVATNDPPQPDLAPSQMTMCNLRLDLVPKDAIVKIGDHEVRRGAKQAEAPCGSNPLVVTHPRYVNHSAEIVLNSDTPNKLRLRMKRPIVTLRVQSTPNKASVSFNKKRVGKAPLKRNIPAFESVQVSVSSPGYQTYRRKLYPKKNSTMNVHLRKSTTKAPRRGAVSRRKPR